MDDRDSIKAIVEKLKQCPPSAVTWDVSEDRYGPRLTVRPTAPSKLCFFQVEFGPPGSYGLSFGHGLHFENIEVAEFDLIDVANAIMQGDVHERVWRLFDRLVIKAEGSILLDDHRKLQDRMFGILSCFAFYASEESIDYQSYPTISVSEK
jgi:hypothetical protein